MLGEEADEALPDGPCRAQDADLYFSTVLKIVHGGEDEEKVTRSQRPKTTAKIGGEMPCT